MAGGVQNCAGGDTLGLTLLRMPDGAVVTRWWAGFASLGAGIIHLAVLSEHVAEWWLSGVFFLVLGVAQMGWAVLAISSDTFPWTRRVAALNAAVILLWLVSRTIGLPVGPGLWEAEAVGTADLLCSLLEAVVVVLLVLTRRRPDVQGTVVTPTMAQRRMAAVGVLAISGVTVVALVANGPPALSHGHHGHDAGSHEQRAVADIDPDLQVRWS